MPGSVTRQASIEVGETSGLRLDGDIGDGKCTTAGRGRARRIVSGSSQKLRPAVAGALEPELVHPTSERIGVNLQDGPRSLESVYDPARPRERREDMSTLHLLQAWQAVRGRRRGPGSPLGRLRLGGQHRGIDIEHWPLTEDHRALQDVLKLANIPGPVIGGQTGHRLVRHRGHALAKLADKLREKERHKQSDVRPALAQGGDSEREDVEPEEEVRAEPAGGYRLLQIAIGRGNDANVHGLRAAAAHGLELALLEHPEQLDLRLWRKLAHLVQEDRAAICQLETADTPLDRAGKRALDVAEELAFDQPRRDGTAVDLDQRTLPAGAQGLDGPRDQLLAGAGIAGDEHGRVRGCDLLDLAKERQQRWAIADQLGEVVLAVDFLLEVDALALVAILECCDLLVSPHVLDGQRDLVRDLTEEHGIRLRVLAGIDAGDGQDADTPAVYDQGNDDVGPHTISIGLLVG